MPETAAPRTPSKKFRPKMTELHNWGSIIAIAVMYFIFYFGTISFFKTEIDIWTHPDVDYTYPESTTKILQQIITQLTIHNFSGDKASIVLPDGKRGNFSTVSWSAKDDPKQYMDSILDPRSGLFSQYISYGGEFFYQMHYELNYLPHLFARFLIVLVAVMMLIAVITGIIIHKKIFTDFFTFRKNKSLRSWMDFHAFAGVIPLPFVLLMTYTGIIIMAYTFWPWGITAAFGHKADYYANYRTLRTVKAEEPTAALNRPLFNIDKIVRELEQEGKKK